VDNEKYNGYVKVERVYILITVSLLIGFLSGVVLAIYKSPGSSESQSATVTQEQNGGHDMAAVESQVTATPNDPGAWIHLGNAYFDTDQPAEAIKAFTRALELAPGNADVLTDLGVMYRRNEQPDKALLIFEQAIKVAPTHELARLNMGVVLFYDKQDQTRAFTVWEELLAINPMAQIPSGDLLKDFMTGLQKP
jgi:cytochrome c-type biogenesis protein CcmH/NrfG